MPKKAPRYFLSVIDDRCSAKEAFSRVLNYFDPNKGKGAQTKVLDSTCSVMRMWSQVDKDKYCPVTNDIRLEIEANYHLCCSRLTEVLSENFDVIVYDPPYVNLKKRNDTIMAETTYGYEEGGTIEQLIDLTERSAREFRKMINRNGIVLVKICDFHIGGRLRGSFNTIKAFEENGWRLFDKVIYRFYKSIPNINFYSRKVPIVHTYFLIFKEDKGIHESKDCQ